MPETLPYPGYCWPLNHHIGPVLQDLGRTMFELLFAGFVYSGEPSYQERITAYIVSTGLLPPNIRDDAQRAQVWRDYQQVLAELGCIVSTRFTQSVELTPIGLMWLDGSIGFSELITTQALRYQYPNGHKQDISVQLKRLFPQGELPATLTELDAIHEIQVKPTILILRVLLELLRRGDQTPRLGVDEILTALVPITRNEYWEEAIANLEAFRGRRRQAQEPRRRRHIQEWMRLLNYSDIFSFDGHNLTLSEIAYNSIDRLSSLCEYHENRKTFWVPASTESQVLGVSWFEHFGSPNFNSEWTQPWESLDSDYLERNYPRGFDASGHTDTDVSLKEWRTAIALRPIELSAVTQELDLEVGRTRQPDEQRILAGIVQRRKRTQLHQKIVRLVASKLQEKRYIVMEDPLSVDLLAVRAHSQTG